ncbi:MAG: response regulator [Desulfuromonadaceae bacterium]|nr:response regulator [Desulfuromonadaceae bacterium]
MINHRKPKKLGEIFVENKLLSQVSVDRVLKQAFHLERRFGEVLEDLGLITGSELAHALADQYGVKTIDHLEHIGIDTQLLHLIPVEQAMRCMIFPLKRDTERLALAMIDPTDTRTIAAVEHATGLRVVPYVATKDEIRAEISRHYLHREPHRSETRTVLVVDDDELVRTMLKDFLEEQKYRVLLASDGMEAFKIIIADNPHVVITDMEMPKLNGYGLLSAALAIPELRHTPIILMIGKVKSPEEERTAFEKGFFDVIMKPFSKATIQSRVKRAFHFYDHQYRLY